MNQFNCEIISSGMDDLIGPDKRISERLSKLA